MGELILMPSPAEGNVEPYQPIIPDAWARERALDITQSWIVEAPAGSGKTGLLIQRFLKLLAAENVDDPAEVLAITFTRKATSEMQDRVLSQLTAAQRGDTPKNAFDAATRPLAQAVLARDVRMGWNLIDHPRRLNIRTIDALCADIAHSLPILSGSGGREKPVEDPSPLYAAAARRTLMLLGGSDHALSSALRTLLLHRDGNLSNCETLITTMLMWRDQWGEHIPLSRSDLDESYLDTVVLPKLEKALDGVICRGLTRLTQVLPGPVLQTLCSLAAEMAHAEGYRGASSPIAICKGRNQSPEEKAEDLNHWHALIHLLVKPSHPRDWRKSVSKNNVGFEILRHHQEELKSIIVTLEETPYLIDELCLIDCLPPSKYPQEQWLVTKALFHVLGRALIELQRVFSETAQCDFTELALLAKSALSRDEAADDFGVSSGMHLQHILVDEMQDTSSSQYEFIQLLTQHWDGHSQTVFLVGDPKQSIYLFRQARVERFVHTMLAGKFGELPLGTLHLTANFRSQFDLVQSFNHDFSLIFPRDPNPMRPELVPYREATAVRLATAGPDRVWHTRALPFSDLPAERSAASRAQAKHNAAEIRRVVELWRARPLPPGRTEPWKIAVLVRNRSHLLDVINAFKNSTSADSIPFRAIDVEPLGDRQEILDLVALTRALLHPADRTAWLALLRTPWCGLTLADLHLLVGQDDPSWAHLNIFSLISQRGELLSEDGMVRLKSFWTTMDAAEKQRGRMLLSRWVQRTWHAFGAPAFTSADALANIERYFTLLDQLEEPGGVLSISKLNARLKRLYAASSLNQEAVDLMTIHGAKGLEWDVVFVPALERIGQTSHSRLLSWLEIDGSNEFSVGDVAHGMIAPIRSKGGASRELNLWIDSTDTAREAAERKRLFYVACTRAREELHLFAAPLRKKDGEIGVPTGSLLHSVWPAVEHLFSSLVPDTVVAFPPAQPLVTQVITSLAANAQAPSGSRIILRIPNLHAAASAPDLANDRPTRQRLFERPDGSFAARSFGTAMHTFLELLTTRIAKGVTPGALLSELPTWAPRISSVLRASGLLTSQIERFTSNILVGLTRTLQQPDGQWILAAHPGATSENSLISWRNERSSIRLDRTFLAGPHPHSPGSNYRWIVDYKTATHGKEGSETFLAQEREKYSPQLETYALALSSQDHPVRLALFHPMLAKLTWWEPHQSTSPAD